MHSETQRSTMRNRWGLYLFVFPVLVGLCHVQFASAQELLSARPGRPVVCYYSHQNRQDHVPASDKFVRLRHKVGRVKTSVFEVEYINFPSDNLAKGAFQYAIEIWESELISSVPIRIRADWRELDAGVLGQALWGSAYANFGGEQHTNTFYPVALAEKIARRDLNSPNEPDIVASFNSKAPWYFGTDGNTPNGKMDLVTIVLHEIAHGLGFTDTYDVEDSEGSVGLPDGERIVPFVFDVFVTNDAAENLLHDFDTPSAELGTELQSTSLFFDSPLSIAVLDGARPELYAPTTFNSGSSISHLDEGAFNGSGDANRLMTPQIDFAESIHTPGTLLLAMLSDMGWVYTNIDHVALKDTERQDGQPHPVTAFIRSDNGYDPGQVKLHYTTDGINFTIVTMTPTGVADQFGASLPGSTGNRAYAYFISIADASERILTNPGKIQEPGKEPEQGTYFFNIGPDLASPEILHEPVKFVSENDTDLELTAEVNDNLGIAEVMVEYVVNGGPLQTEIMNRVGLTDQHNASLPLPILGIGDKIEYRLLARDLAAIENVSTLPTNGFFIVTVIGIKPVQDSYYNNFNETSQDFFGNNFTISTPVGFNDGAIHSDHPYKNGSGPNDESNYTYQLQIPVRIGNTNPVIRFDEIVLVEPGADGAVFGDDDFFDYVVVEGSADEGVSWQPFASGYDSRDQSVWLTRYDEDISEDNSQSKGDPSLFRPRAINMLENESFSEGDEVLIRFRLFADQLAHGWGWAIDNLSVQGPVTGISEVFSGPIEIYPVPVMNDLMVKFSNLAGNDIAELQIVDLQGKTVYREQTGAESPTLVKSIDVQRLPPGLYILRIRSGNQSWNKKFLKAPR